MTLENCTTCPTMLPRVRRIAFVLLLLGALGLASCGGGSDDKESVDSLLDRAFSTPIHSADLKLQAKIDLDGLLSNPLQIQAEGPFRTNKGKLPSANIDLEVGTGTGQTISSGVLTTGDRVFVKFQDVYFEQPRAQVAKTNRTIAHSRNSGQSLRELGLDPRSWIAEAKIEDDANVAGTDTHHVSGTLDVTRLMRNINEFVSRSSSALGSGGKAAPKLSAADIAELAQTVKNPTFDVYVGKQDSTIRRVSGRIEFDVPTADRSSLGGLTGGTITFSIELRNVNGHQKIEAPASSRPLSQLTKSLGGALGALGGGAATPSAPSDGSSGGGSGDSEQFQRYAQCLDKAKPGDTEQLQRCADLLQGP
jgi:hypothetical protein